MPIADWVADLIHERGPFTVAAFMDLALYDPEHGYYARAARRSGRAGDFFTSVDVGPMFGELLAIQVAEMGALLQQHTGEAAKTRADVAGVFDVVEAGAGNGRLSADLLRALRRNDPLLYERTRLHLVEASAEARAAQRLTLDDVADRLASSAGVPPADFEGVVIANELLDALPVHQVVMRAEGLREIYVDVRDHRLATREGPPSTPELAEYLDAAGVALEPGWRVEINLRAVAWIRDLAARLRRGFVILIDYGHDARELYSATHAAGTLTTFSKHTMAGPGSESRVDTPMWLERPGEQDLTAHVDFSSVRQAAERGGLTTLGFLDQTYFLLALADLERAERSQTDEHPEHVGASRASRNVPLANLGSPENFKQRLALKTLLMPGGLGSTHKVLILGKGVGTPALRGCAYRMRVT